MLTRCLWLLICGREESRALEQIKGLVADAQQQEQAVIGILYNTVFAAVSV